MVVNTSNLGQYLSLGREEEPWDRVVYNIQGEKAKCQYLVKLGYVYTFMFEILNRWPFGKMRMHRAWQSGTVGILVVESIDLRSGPGVGGKGETVLWITPDFWPEKLGCHS